MHVEVSAGCIVRGVGWRVEVFDVKVVDAPELLDGEEAVTGGRVMGAKRSG